MSKLSICHASLLESYLSVKLAICQSYLFVMLATCHSYMSKQLAHLVPVLRKFLVKLPLITQVLFDGQATDRYVNGPSEAGRSFLHITLMSNLRPVGALGWSNTPVGGLVARGLAASAFRRLMRCKATWCGTRPSEWYAYTIRPP